MSIKSYPKKSLGQHFLIDNNIKNMIISALKIKKYDLVVEIGPGQGAITDKLANLKLKKLMIIEKDKELSHFLSKKYKHVEVINEDFLKWNVPENLQNIKIIGNLPYNISTQIIFKVLKFYNVFKTAVFMIQKEVADRILAKNNDKNFSMLSVITQTFSIPEKLFNVSPNCFYPKPKVDSTVIKFNIENRFDIKEFDNFFIFVKSLFYGRRKKLINILKNNPFTVFDKNFLDFFLQKYSYNKRIADFTIEDIVKLYNFNIQTKVGCYNKDL